MKRILFFIVSLILSVFVGHSQDAGERNIAISNKKMNPGKIGNTYALIVGASDYFSTNIRPLPGAKADADAFCNLLLHLEKIPRKNIHVITSQNATSDSVMLLLRYLFNIANESDRIILYFAGHGDVSPELPTGFLLQYNFSKADGDMNVLKGIVKFEYLKDQAKTAADLGINVILIADACKAGAIINKDESTAELMEQMKGGSASVKKLLSCGPNESARDGEDRWKGHGAFTYYLLMGMAGLASKNDNDTMIILKQLYTYILNGLTKDGLEQMPEKDGDVNASLMHVDRKLKEKAETEGALALAPFDESPAGKSTGPRGMVDQAPDKEDILPVKSQLLLNAFNKSLKSGHLIRKDFSVPPDPPMVSSDSIFPFNPHKGRITKILISPNDLKWAFIIASNPLIYLGDIETRTVTHTLKAHTMDVEDISFSHDGRYIVSCSKDRSIKIWDTDTGGILRNISTDGFPLHAFYDPSDQHIIVSFTDGMIKIYDPKDKSNEPLSAVAAHDGKINATLVDTHNNLITIGNDKEVQNLKIWKLDKLKKPKVFDLKRNSVYEALICPNSDSIVSVNDKGDFWSFGKDPYNSQSFLKPTNKIVRTSALGILSQRNILFRAGGTAAGISMLKMDQRDSIRTLHESEGKTIDAMAISPSGSYLMYADHFGLISFDYLHSNPVYANEMLHKIEQDTLLKEQLFPAKQSFYLALKAQAQAAIDDILSGINVTPTAEETKDAIEDLDEAMNLFPADSFSNKDLKCTQLFLEGYDIILKNDFSKFPDAMGKFKEILAKQPNSVYPYIGISTIEQMENRQDSVLKTASMMSSKIPRWSEPYRLMANAQFSQGHYDTIEKLYKRIINLYPEAAKGYYLIGKEQEQLGFYKSAEASYINALNNAYDRKSEGEEEPPILANYASMQIKRGGYDDAIYMLESAIHEDSTYQFPYQLLGDLYFQQYKDSEVGLEELQQQSLRYYEKAVQLAPYDPSTYISLGNFYTYQGLSNKESTDNTGINIAPDSVIMYFKKSIQLNPYSVDGYAGLGWCQWIFKDDKNAAFEQFEQAIKIDPNASKPYYNLGAFYSELNDTVNAIAYMLKALEKDKKSQDSYLAIMKVYEKNNEPAKLDQTYAIAAKALPMNPVIPFELAKYYYSKENFIKAEGLLRKSIETDPKFKNAYNSYEELINNPKAKNIKFKELPKQKVDYNSDHVEVLADKNLLVCKDKMYFVTDTNRHVIRKLKDYDQIIVMKNSNDAEQYDREKDYSFVVGKGGKWGWMNQVYEEVVPPLYDSIFEKQSMVLFKQKKLWGSYSPVKGEGIVVPAAFKSWELAQEEMTKVLTNAAR